MIAVIHAIKNKHPNKIQSNENWPFQVKFNITDDDTKPTDGHCHCITFYIKLLPRNSYVTIVFGSECRWIFHISYLKIKIKISWNLFNGKFVSFVRIGAYLCCWQSCTFHTTIGLLYDSSFTSIMYWQIKIAHPTYWCSIFFGCETVILYSNLNENELHCPIARKELLHECYITIKGRRWYCLNNNMVFNDLFGERRKFAKYQPPKEI